MRNAENCRRIKCGIQVRNDSTYYLLVIFTYSAIRILQGNVQGLCSYQVVLKTYAKGKEIIILDDAAKSVSITQIFLMFLQQRLMLALIRTMIVCRLMCHLPMYYLI